MRPNINYNSGTMQVIDGRLVATLNAKINGVLLEGFRKDLLDKVRDTGVRQVIVDVSAILLMDSSDVLYLKDTLDMVGVLGAYPILVGLNKGLVSSLIYLDVDLGSLRTELNLEGAIRYFNLRAA